MKRYSRDDETSYSLGMSLTIEALKHRESFVEKIFLSSKAAKNRELDTLIELCGRAGVPYVYDDRTIEKLSSKENCYCIGVFRKFKTPLSDGDHLILYGFNDLGELGTTIRSAVSFDITDIILMGGDIDHFDPACVRSSMGSLFHCNMAQCADLGSYRRAYPERKISPLLGHGGRSIEDLRIESPFTLMISQGFCDLDAIFEDGFSILDGESGDISLSIRSAVFLSQAYHMKRSR